MPWTATRPAAGVVSITRRKLYFINKIAGQFAKLAPGKELWTRAYSNNVTAPGNMKAADNVMIMFTPAGRDYSKPLNDPTSRANTFFNKQLMGWLQAAKQVVMLSGYDSGYWGSAPFPCYNTIRKDMQYYKQIGVKGMFTTYNFDWFSTKGLAYYIMAAGLWNPDNNDAMRDYCRGYFGPASDDMRRYYDELDRLPHKLHNGLYAGWSHQGKNLFTPTLLRRLEKILDNNARKVANVSDTKYAERISRLQLQLQFTVEYIAAMMWDRTKFPTPRGDADKNQGH